jgi:hypothetical protein
MATREELYDALRNADKAGDTEGARKLATYIQSLPAEEPAKAAVAEAPSGAPEWLARANDVGASFLKNTQGALAEPAAQIASGMIATPVAGLAGMAQGIKNFIPGFEGMPAADRVRQVENAITYEPRTTAGNAVSGVVSYPFAKLAQFGDWAGQKTSDLTGSPAAGATVNTAIQLAPAALFKLRGVRGASGAQSTAGAATRAPVTPAAAAENYVASRTSLDWNALSDSVKARLTDIAKDSRSLDKLDPAAVERQARLESLPVPVTATRGQLTRDPVQLRNEGNVSATEAGKPIRDTYQQQTKQLLDNLDVLKGKVRGTGKNASTAETPEQVGASVQDAARAKLKEQQDKVKSLYKLAEAKGELQGDVPTAPIKAVIEESPDLTHLGWVDSWLKKTGKGDTRSLKELEDLRQAAVARAMDGGTEGYYAGKVISAIDQATDGAGGSAYKAARAARRAQAMEFEEQGGVARLVENKSHTDRATALEDTWRKTVLGGSIEDLKNVKKSLLTGSPATRSAGRKAWRDLRAQTVQHIRDEATKSVTRYENGTPNVTPASMERAIKSIGPDKLEEIFGPGTVRRLNQIMEATRDIKTEPPTGFKGSPTFANIIAFLEKGIGKVPVVGDTVTGAVRGISKLREIGAAGREVRQAQKTPLDEGIESMTAAQRRAKIAEQLKSSAKSSAPFSTVPQQQSP